jgi:glycine/serine hydroxymethyltransferase
MDENDMRLIASLIARAVKDADGSDIPAVAEEVSTLVAAKPAYAS